MAHTVLLQAKCDCQVGLNAQSDRGKIERELGDGIDDDDPYDNSRYHVLGAAAILAPHRVAMRRRKGWGKGTGGRQAEKQRRRGCEFRMGRKKGWVEEEYSRSGEVLQEPKVKQDARYTA